MTNEEVSQKFAEYAAMLTWEGKTFRRKIEAYEKASTIIKYLDKDIFSIDSQSQKGIGPSIAGKIKEMKEINTFKKYEELKKVSPPPSILQFKKIQGIGDVGVLKLWNTYKVPTLKELYEKLKKKEIDDSDLEMKVKYALESGERITLHSALKVSNIIFVALREQGEILDSEFKIIYGGSVRRNKPTVHDVDIAACIKREHFKTITDMFLSFADEIVVNGPFVFRIIVQKVQIELSMITKDQWGPMSLHITGSSKYNEFCRKIAKSNQMQLNQYGLTYIANGERVIQNAKDENDILVKLAIPYIPPELREEEMSKFWETGLDKIYLVEEVNIETDYHIHSKYSDGQGTIRELVEEAKYIKLKCIAITDHAKNLHIAGGLNDEQLKQQIEEIKEINKELQKNKENFKVLVGLEFNINKDGEIDQYPEELMNQLEIRIGSIHSAFEGDQTERLLKAIKSGKINIIGHPTGQEYGKRKTINVDWNKIFNACKEHKVALEMTGQPTRIGLPQMLCQLAKAKGVKFTVGSDAHHIKGMNYIKYSVQRLRRGGIEYNDLLESAIKTNLLKQ